MKLEDGKLAGQSDGGFRVIEVEQLAKVNEEWMDDWQETIGCCLVTILKYLARSPRSTTGNSKSKTTAGLTDGQEHTYTKSGSVPFNCGWSKIDGGWPANVVVMVTDDLRYQSRHSRYDRYAGR